MELYLLFIIPPLIFMIYAQWRVSSAYGKYSKTLNMANITGLQAAKLLLEYNGLHEVQVELSKGKLSDHYDPKKRALRLSPEVANKPSVAAVGIVAHEVGHAVQHARSYSPLIARNAIFPVANLGSNLGFILVLVGFFIYAFGAAFGLTITWIGVGLFSIAVLFTLITLPVEINASSRARIMLQSTSLVSAREVDGVNAVLSAAALTYVAALLQAVAQLLYFVMLALGMGRR
jgi:Zn-dependent membrane protease YugP